MACLMQQNESWGKVGLPSAINYGKCCVNSKVMLNARIKLCVNAFMQEMETST